jgi:nucleoside-diphosphate-sugar epimerase
MKVLVTGGAGFIGPHLSERLVLQRRDVCESLMLEVDQIYNLACPASPVHYQYNSAKTVKSNVMGTLNMLVLAQRVGARIFDTYGPRMAENDGRVVSNFIVQAIRGQELTLSGTGEQTRTFCYVDDLMDGLIRLMEVDRVHEPVNPGNPSEFSIRELAEEIADCCGRTLSVTIALREGLERTVPYFQRLLHRGHHRRVKRVVAAELPFVERRGAYTEALDWTDHHRP